MPSPAAQTALQARFGEQYSVAAAVREAHARDESRLDYQKNYVAQERADTLELMRELKALFDPRGLLNPGKIL